MSGKVVVIGAGPAGMMAASVAHKRGRDVIIAEKNKMYGKKLRITGKGRCNITNDADISDFFANVPTNNRFLYSSFYSFDNVSVVEYFNSLGVATKVERGGRIFPVSDRANDVADAMERDIKNVKKINKAVKDIIVKDGAVSAVKFFDNEIVECESVIIATGGKSYPGTGSTGDGYRFAEKLGHTVIAPKASLVPIEVKEKWINELMGLSLRNIKLKVFDTKGKEVFSDFGEMIFTHFGISGPCAISASSHMKDGGEYKISIDLKPALDFDKLDKRIVRDFDKFSRKQFKNSLDELLPKKMIPVIIKLSGISEDKFVNQITHGEREQLVNLIKNFELTFKKFRPIDEAIITSGGVSTKEINPSTMESKLVKGVFFAGEVIDVDAYTGGFNLQIAFSTGHLAGENA